MANIEGNLIFRNTICISIKLVLSCAYGLYKKYNTKGNCLKAKQLSASPHMVDVKVKVTYGICSMTVLQQQYA